MNQSSCKKDQQKTLTQRAIFINFWFIFSVTNVEKKLIQNILCATASRNAEVSQKGGTKVSMRTAHHGPEAMGPSSQPGHRKQQGHCHQKCF